MTRSFPATRKLAAGGATAIFVLLAAVLTGVGLAGSPSTQTFHSVDARLCPFTLDVKVTRKLELRRVGDTKVKVFGPTEVTLRNKTTGRTVVLNASGTSSLDPATGNVTFSGRQLWLGPANHVPYLSTVGKGSRQAPHFVLAGADLHRRVIDPCALLASAAADAAGRDTGAVGVARVRAEPDRLRRTDPADRHPGPPRPRAPRSDRQRTEGHHSGGCRTGRACRRRARALSASAREPFRSETAPQATSSPQRSPRRRCRPTRASGIIHIQSDRPGHVHARPVLRRVGRPLRLELRRRLLHRRRQGAARLRQRQSACPATLGKSCSAIARRSRSSSAARATSARSRRPTPCAGPWAAEGPGSARASRRSKDRSGSRLPRLR